MALTNSDLFIIERGGVQYQMDAEQLLTFVRASTLVADVASRDALSPVTGQRVYVQDASADPTVDAGGALYIWTGAAWDKVAENESFDNITVAPTDLGFTPSPTNGLLTSSTGEDATITVVNATNAGLATPQMFVDSHAAATAAGTNSTNPVTVTGQAIGFSISNLAALP